MILEFDSRKVKTVTITKAILAFVIPDFILRIEPDFMVIKERGDWYRKLLNCDNTLCFQLMSDLEHEVCVIFDSNRDEIDGHTKLDFLYEDNTFKCEILQMMEFSLDAIIDSVERELNK